MRGRLIKKEIHIGNNSWIGTGVIILPGVKIGERAIVAAGAIITKDLQNAIANKYIRYCYIYGNSNPKDFKQAIQIAKKYGGGSIKPFKNKVMNFLNRHLKTHTLLNLRQFLLKK